MFPQDHTFDKDDLVRMWIALGFIQPSQGMTMEEKEKSKWENVLAPLASGGFGSKILVTTRTDSVALMFAKKHFSSIYIGHGGMGKTTLMQHIYEDEMTKEFDHKIPSLDTLDALQKSLKSETLSKKFLLLLDDIWENDDEQDKSKWENVLATQVYGNFAAEIRAGKEEFAEFFLRSEKSSSNFGFLGMVAKNVDALEERLEGEMNQIKETVEERMSSMEGQVADLRDMMKKMLEFQTQSTASHAKGPEAKNTNFEIHREEEERYKSISQMIREGFTSWEGAGIRVNVAS
ncbi:hypothetical protein M5K25_009819 [Dendrobium thyrsiflorum]|uniref:Disease resistance protein winged helix domain-containing protein n=1 Tax=Dendrobium thyrsiflorum TaxID=117978 RepID=A0ABD0VDG8_DENTH